MLTHRVHFHRKIVHLLYLRKSFVVEKIVSLEKSNSSCCVLQKETSALVSKLEAVYLALLGSGG